MFTSAAQAQCRTILASGIPVILSLALAQSGWLPGAAWASDEEGEADTATGLSPAIIWFATQDSDQPPTPAIGPEIYTSDRTLSPLTPDIVSDLRALVASSPGAADNVLAKLGAAETVSSNFLHCFAGSAIDLAGRPELQATIDFFLAGDAAGTNPYQRASEAARVGWAAHAILSGSPTPLQLETAALSPRFAVVHFGTNDIQFGNIVAFGEHLLDIADQLLAAGVIPVFTSVPPRDDSAAADLEVPRYNGVIRAVAQARQVPFIDYHRELIPLADHGLSADGVHPTVYRPGGVARACEFTLTGLAYGYNIRNLITLQMLDRLRLSLLEADPAPDTRTHTIDGAGTAGDPIAIAQYPFADVRNTAESGQRNFDSYPGCGTGIDESGPELIYQLDLSQTTSIRGIVIDRGATDIDVHILSGALDNTACVARGHEIVTATLPAGTHYISLDTFVNAGTELAGEYVFILLEE